MTDLNEARRLADELYADNKVKSADMITALVARVEAAERDAERLRAWVASDSTAISFQTMGQYRTALLAMFDEARKQG